MSETGLYLRFQRSKIKDHLDAVLDDTVLLVVVDGEAVEVGGKGRSGIEGRCGATESTPIRFSDKRSKLKCISIRLETFQTKIICQRTKVELPVNKIKCNRSLINVKIVTKDQRSISSLSSLDRDVRAFDARVGDDVETGRMTDYQRERNLTGDRLSEIKD